MSKNKKIGTLAVIIVLFLIACLALAILGLWQASKLVTLYQSHIIGEQRENETTLRNLIPEIDQLINQLDEAATEFEKTPTAIKLADKKRILEITQELAQKSRLIQREYLLYATDISVQTCPFRGLQKEDFIGKVHYSAFLIDRVISSTEKTIYAYPTKDNWELTQKEILQAQKFIENLKSNFSIES